MDTNHAALLPLIVADVFELAGRFRDDGEAIARAAGQTQARWQVLSAASAEPKTVPQVARRLGVARQSVQRIADLLVADGLATFADNPDHRTSPHLVLSATGEDILARLSAAAATSHAEIAAVMTPADIAALHADLRRMLATLARHPATPSTSGDPRRHPGETP